MSRWPLLIFRSVGQGHRSCLFFICWGRGALVFYKHLYLSKLPAQKTCSWNTKTLHVVWYYWPSWCTVCANKWCIKLFISCNPMRIIKCDQNGFVSWINRKKGWPSVGAWKGTLKKPTKCLLHGSLTIGPTFFSVGLHIYVPSHV